jgi:hypothetical protein
VASGLSAKDLVSADFDKLNWYESIGLYGRSWLLTHYLTFSAARRGQLGIYLDAMEKGVPGLDAAKAAFGDLDALGKELNAYRATRDFIGLTIDAKVLSPGRSVFEPLTPERRRSCPHAFGRKADTTGVQPALGQSRIRRGRPRPHSRTIR